MYAAFDDLDIVRLCFPDSLSLALRCSIYLIFLTAFQITRFDAAWL